MNITDEISTKLGLPIVEELSSHVQGQYHRFDDGSAEVEILEFLYSLVRLIKPEEICETGSYLGLSGAYLALGLKKNGRGHLDTIEWTEERLNIAKDKWTKLELNDFITAYHMSSLEFQTAKRYDLMLLDTEPQTRFLELDRFWNNLKPGGIVVIHDLSWDLGSGAPQFWLNKNLLDKRIKNHELQVLNFFSPRGLSVFYKPRPEDEVYKLLKGEKC